MIKLYVIIIDINVIVKICKNLNRAFFKDMKFQTNKILNFLKNLVLGINIITISFFRIKLKDIAG